PRWKRTSGDEDDPAQDNDERLETYRGVRGEFRPRRPMNGDDADDEIVDNSVGRRRGQMSGTYTLSELESADDRLNDEIREDMTATRDGDPLRGGDSKLADAALQMSDAAHRLTEAGGQLEHVSRAADAQRLKMYEGTFTASGTANVAGV